MIPVVDPVRIKVKKIILSIVNVMEIVTIINIIMVITFLDHILIAKVQPVPNLGGINLPHHLGTYPKS